ncbi:uncharacterized protein N7484_002678 [Penicillium longicatenatum]|uniref:uncharacterized protein n=1 Tax=Penicillium longicatenatum TaxID=1561947 RepID=UPI002546F2A9|nr:uncharacterized protein N7484_002678 [Penicillium longicatenatum]KAJ5648955.1 hypothetical protein N7484_002678 [Penicillium longicatenatum]
MQPSNSTLSKRRRFQPSITTYFPTESTASNATVSHNHYSTATFSATPVVPAKVQSSLLSVGMRVRKSVADGYKTQISLEKEKAVPAMSTPVAQTYTTNGYSELAPFSGMGRSAVTDDGDDYSLPPSSQESMASTDSAPIMLNGQKRRLGGGNDIFADDDSDMEDNQLWRDVPLGRTILSPSLGQQRRRFLAIQRKSQLNETPGMDLDDFEEATFLRRREEVDTDSQMDCV